MFLLWLIAFICTWKLCSYMDNKGYNVDKFMGGTLSAIFTILIFPVALLAGLMKRTK